MNNRVLPVRHFWSGWKKAKSGWSNYREESKRARKAQESREKKRRKQYDEEMIHRAYRTQDMYQKGHLPWQRKYHAKSHLRTKPYFSHNNNSEPHETPCYTAWTGKNKFTEEWFAEQDWFNEAKAYGTYSEYYTSYRKQEQEYQQKQQSKYGKYEYYATYDNLDWNFYEGEFSSFDNNGYHQRNNYSNNHQHYNQNVYQEPSNIVRAKKILDLSENMKTVDVKEIKLAYKKKAMIHHPDRGGNSVVFNQVTEAYESLLAYKEQNPTN